MLDKQELYARVQDAPWAGYTDEMCIGGAGGLGSWLALQLARVGHRLMVYDNDNVGQENIGGGQLYKRTQIGRPKVEALRENIWEFAGSSGFTGLERFEAKMGIKPACFVTFDNMESRKDMVETWLSRARRKSANKDLSGNEIWACLNISMLPEGGFIEVIDKPSRGKRWLEEWQPSSEIGEIACSFKATTYNVSIITGMAVQIFNNIVHNKLMGFDLKYVPYRTIWDGTLLKWETHE